MHRFTNIVFSALGNGISQLAVQRAVGLAEGNQAKLTLLAVIEPQSPMERLLDSSTVSDSVQEGIGRAVLEELFRYVPTGTSCRIEGMVELGSPSEVIIERVVSAQHDLLVVADDTRGGAHSIIQRLLRHCPCPVWVIRPTSSPNQRVLAAVDTESSDADMSRTILELARSMFDLFGGELHVVHAWELYGEDTLRHSAFLHVDSAEVEAMLEQQRIDHRRALGQLLNSPGISRAPWRMHMCKGSPTQVIHDVATECQVNLLVMGTIGRSGVVGKIMGNTAEQVLDQVRCSVVAVKP